MCLSVIQRSHDLKFGFSIDLDNISDFFEGQVHRSKVKVAMLKNMIFFLFVDVTCVDRADPIDHAIWRHMTSRCDVTMSHDVTV